MSILAIIPARAGSKRCRDKNIRSLDGLNIVEWTLNALPKGIFDKVCISSNISKMKHIAQLYNVDFIQRPAKLCEDSSTEFEFVGHALKHYDQLCKYDEVAILYPTTPFKKKETIESIVEKWERIKVWANGIRTVRYDDDYTKKRWHISQASEEIAPCNAFCQGFLIYMQVPYLYIYKSKALDRDYRKVEPMSYYCLTDWRERHDINYEQDWQIARWIAGDINVR